MGDNILLITIIGAAVSIVYVSLVMFAKERKPQVPSSFVVVCLIVLSVTMGLVRYSRIYDQSMSTRLYAEVAAWALVAPFACIGLLVVGYIASWSVFGPLAINEQLFHRRRNGS